MIFKNKEVAICAVANVAYLQHYAACLYSFLAQHPGSHHFFLFSDDAENQHIEKIRSHCEKSGSTLKLLKLNPNDFDGFGGHWQNFGKQVYYRFLIPQLIPEQYKYVLYTDVDIVFAHALNFDVAEKQDAQLWAVEDSIAHILAPKRGLTSYFNSGFMLIDVEQWREKDVTQSLFTLEPPKRLFADQEILNAHFKDQWAPLPAVYNASAHSLNFTMIGLRTKNGKKPSVIHFMGGLKPWRYWVRGSFLYWKAVWQTPFKWQVLQIPKTIFASITHKITKPFKNR